ncbi:MAG: hypothetical protein HYX63_03595 [Gammaproteobacteria bacterium]|nr:hypothetical protein [Gammaproteobacteria bacterium]
MSDRLNTSPPRPLRHRGSRSRWAYSAQLVLGLISTGVVAAQSVDAVSSRYSRLLQQVMASDSTTQRTFSEIALAAVINANRVEMARANATQDATRRWAGGAAGYVARLDAIAGGLERATDIQIIAQHHGTALLVIDGQQVMISAPRDSRQRHLENAIVDTVCGQIDCAAPAAPLVETIMAEERDITKEWAFGDNRPPLLSTSDGLHCVFEDARHLRLKEAACAGVMRDLRLVAEGVRAVAERGAIIDWTTFGITPSRAGEGSRVVYDRAGDYFQLDVPYIASAEPIWREAIPWLQARLRGYVANYVIKAPEKLAYFMSPANAVPP